MTPFAYMFLAHLIGDYLFQTSWMAANKATKWDALLVHSFVYTATLTIMAFLTFGGLPVWAIIFIFLSHVLLDRRTFVIWWVTNIMRTDIKQVGWLVIMADQVFHLIVIGIVLHFSL